MNYIILLRDCLEIIFYACLIYAFCVWLKTDKTKNILVCFLAYCTLTICAWYANMPTLAPFLCTYAPIAIIILIVLHEKTLQRNLIALTNITSSRTIENWLDALLGSILITLNNNKNITIIIENKDALDYFLTTPLMINADLTKDILTILLASNAYEDHTMMWVTNQGIIRALNASWVQETTVKENIKNTFFNKKDALFYTLQSDALVLHAHPLTRAFTLISNGKETSSIPINEIKNHITKQLSLSLSIKAKEVKHESSTTENHFL